MVAYNFRARWADKVERGEKTQTIRRHRNGGRHVRPGERIQLYVGQRTKDCRKLGEGICTSVQEIEIDRPEGRRTIVLDGQVLCEDDVFAIASDDGFETLDEMFAFFGDMHGLPFSGVLIRWELEANARNNLPERSDGQVD